MDMVGRGIRTAFAEEVEIAFVCLLALPLASFLELAGFVAGDGTCDIERTTMQD